MSGQRIQLSPGYHAEPGETKGHQHDIYTTIPPLHGNKRLHVGTLMKEAVAAWSMQAQARPYSEWTEEDGYVLWWRFPIEEPPYCGSPQDLGHTVEVAFRQHGEPESIRRYQVGGWPGYHTHWTPIPVPPAPCDGSGASRRDAQRLDPKDDSAAREAGAPDPTPTLKREGQS